MWCQRRFFLLIKSRCFHTNQICQTTDLTFGLNKVEVKHLKRRIEKGKSDLKQKHIYNQAFSINNKFDLARRLIESEVYHEEGDIIGLVKPYGISHFKHENHNESGALIKLLNSSGFISPTSIEDVLPLLREHYQAPKLNILFIPERYTSGIMLLSYGQKAYDRIKKSFRRSNGLGKPYQTYWAVVHGITVPEAAAERVATHFSYIQNVGSKVPLIKKDFSKEDVKRGRVKTNVVEHVVLAHHPENDVSLVEVNVLNNKNHFIRVWLSYCCSPVFGDRLFSGRVKTIMGKRLPLKPTNYSAYQIPDISPKLLEKLELSRAHIEIIPPHVHLSKLKIETPKKVDDVEITASPPDYFNWTCSNLSLMSDEHPADVDGPVEINTMNDIEKVEEEEFLTES